MELVRNPQPAPEAVTWDGSNNQEVVDLILRVAGLNVWSPLNDSPFTTEVIPEGELHPGLNVTNSVGQIVARVEEGNTLVFDLFATTPLFVLAPHELEVFYGGN